jgi:hypothetical protein
MSSRVAAAATAAVVLFYAVLGLGMLAPQAVYSGDIGVKYVQARALADRRFTSLDISYPGEFLDPSREFFPLRPPFVMVAGGTTQAIFPPVSAITQAASVALGGFRGLILLSVLSAAIVLVASWKIAPAEYALPVILAVGLGGPLWFYAVSGWEHAPAVALSTAAFAWAMRDPVSRWTPFLAGSLLGAGATLRDEVLLLVPGLLVTIMATTGGCDRRRCRAPGACRGSRGLVVRAAGRRPSSTRSAPRSVSLASDRRAQHRCTGAQADDAARAV